MRSNYWMPFTANRQFFKNPKIIKSAKGLYYTTDHGNKIIDGISGLWCSNLGHARPELAHAISRQISKLDYATAFQVGHDSVFELTNKIVSCTHESESTKKLKHIFFTSSGSESVDTALKIALAYHKACGLDQKIF